MALSGDGDSFEALYRRLEETVAQLEEGGLTLEQAMSLYEEGVKLSRRCQVLLDAAQLRVTQLQADAGPVIRDTGFIYQPEPSLSEEDESLTS